MATGATWLVYAVAFGLMYHYLPDRSVGWRRALGGGAATALALVWNYYAALVVFIGALLTAVVDERAGERSGRKT